MKRIASVTSPESVKRMMDSLVSEMQSAPKSLEENREAMELPGFEVQIPTGMSLQEARISADISGEILTPGHTAGGVILYLHGGGFCTGSAVSHRPLCIDLASSTSWKVASVNYRLAPEHKFPCALDDALESYRWLLQQGHKADNIVIAGDSAGGGLAIATALAISQNWQDTALPMPAGAIGLSPWLDLQCSSSSYETNAAIDLMASAEGLRPLGAAYLGDTRGNHPLASPFYADDLGRMCPVLLQVGSAETLLDEVTAFATKALADGVSVELEIWENMIHVWHSFSDTLPESELALRSVSNWLDALHTR